VDVNEQLRLLRLTVKQWRVDEDPGVRHAHAREIAEYFEALDSHLSAGGRPPEAWAEGPDAPELDDDHLCDDECGDPSHPRDVHLRDDDYTPAAINRTTDQ
jgi:hypothetical protein